MAALVGIVVFVGLIVALGLVAIICAMMSDDDE
jgi:hypothetical protein